MVEQARREIRSPARTKAAAVRIDPVKSAVAKKAAPMRSSAVRVRERLAPVRLRANCERRCM